MKRLSMRGGIMPPLNEGDGPASCPAAEGEPWLHYIHRLAQHLRFIPPGPNPFEDEWKERVKKWGKQAPPLRLVRDSDQRAEQQLPPSDRADWEPPGTEV